MRGLLLSSSRSSLVLCLRLLKTTVSVSVTFQGFFFFRRFNFPSATFYLIIFHLVLGVVDSYDIMMFLPIIHFSPSEETPSGYFTVNRFPIIITILQ